MKQEFEIDLWIYPEDIVKQAISDFEDVWKPNPSPILKGEGSIKSIEINWENKEEIEEIFWEFMNYSIWLINEK